jgi:putative addiction module component (TIGR02574 family)
MAKNSLFDFSDLTPAERLQLAQDLWDSVDSAADIDVLPLTEEQRAELDHRLDDLKANPDEGSPWPDVKKRVLDKLKDGSRRKRGA